MGERSKVQSQLWALNGALQELGTPGPSEFPLSHLQGWVTQPPH